MTDASTSGSNADAKLKSALFEQLAAGGLTSVTVEFDGSGDSGQIESVTAYRGDEPALLDAALKEAIEEACYNHLEHVGLDWYNNDGGYGTFQFLVKEQRIELDCNIRFTDSTNFTFEL